LTIWVESGQETIAVSLSDFRDVDFDPLSFVDYQITNSGLYSRFELDGFGNAIILQPSNTYYNFPTNPDTMEIVVDDGRGGEIAVTFLVWVLEGTGIEYVSSKPKSTALQNAMPNPFNSAVWIEAEFEKATKTEIMVYDNQGKFVKSIYSGKMPPGVFRFKWDGTDADANDAASGSYFIIMNTDNGKSMLKVTLLR